MKCKWLPFIFIMVLGSCFLDACSVFSSLSPSAIQGKWVAVTDYSRDLTDMKGHKNTIFYTNGRDETLIFHRNHRFSAKVHFSSDRLPDQLRSGSWQKVGLNNIEVILHGNKSREYYHLDNPSTLIRLDEHKKRLDPTYTQYFSFFRLDKVNNNRIHQK